MIGFVACEESASHIGNSIIGQNAEIVIDSSFTVTGHTVALDSIIPKTTQQLIGSVNIPAYGNITSDIVAQFLPTVALDTINYSADNIDSLVLTLRYVSGSFIGDSLVPMGLEVYPLTKQLPTDISSKFNPEGYYSPTPIGSQIYNASLAGSSATMIASNRDINVKLPVQLGKDLFNAFVENPDNYANGRVFAENVFPGLYIKNNYGSGRITILSICSMVMHMHKEYIPDGKEELDTISASHLYYLVTPEVINNNNISYKMSQTLADLIEQGHSLMVAPTGAEVEFEFPATDIITSYREATKDGISVINSLSFELPVDTIANGLGVNPPPYVLMVLKKDKEQFFAENKLADNITSFYAIYDATKQVYSFPQLRSFLTQLIDKDEITEEDYTFSLVPAQVNFENLANSGYLSSSTVQTESEILPYLVSPAMADVRFDKAKIIFTYSLQTRK